MPAAAEQRFKSLYERMFLSLVLIDAFEREMDLRPETGDNARSFAAATQKLMQRVDAAPGRSLWERHRVMKETRRWWRHFAAIVVAMEKVDPMFTRDFMDASGWW